ASEILSPPTRKPLRLTPSRSPSHPEPAWMFTAAGLPLTAPPPPAPPSRGSGPAPSAAPVTVGAEAGPGDGDGEGDGDGRGLSAEAAGAGPSGGVWALATLPANTLKAARSQTRAKQA